LFSGSGEGERLQKTRKLAQGTAPRTLLGGKGGGLPIKFGKKGNAPKTKFARGGTKGYLGKKGFISRRNAKPSAKQGKGEKDRAKNENERGPLFLSGGGGGSVFRCSQF